MLDEGGLLTVLEAAWEPPTHREQDLLRDGLAVALLHGGAASLRRARLRGSGRELGRRRRRGLGLRILHPGDRVLELAHAPSERAPHLGQPARTEDEKQHDEQNQELPDRDAEWHGSTRPPGRPMTGPVYHHLRSDTHRREYDRKQDLLSQWHFSRSRIFI